RIFGHDRADYVDNTKWITLVHPDDYPIISKKIRIALSDVDIHHYNTEYRLLTIHGHYAHVIENGYIVRDDSGTAIRMIGVLRDITYRKQQELESNLMLAIGREFIADETLSESLNGTLEHILSYIDLPYGEIWIPHSDGKNLVLTAYKQIDSLKPISHTLKYPIDGGLYGHEWSHKQVMRYSNLLSDPNFMNHDFVHKGGW